MYAGRSVYGCGEVNPITRACAPAGANVVGWVVGGAENATNVLFTAVMFIVVVVVEVEVVVVVDSAVVVGVVSPSIQQGSRCPLICISIALLSVSTVPEHDAGPSVDRKYTS